MKRRTQTGLILAAVLLTAAWLLPSWCMLLILLGVCALGVLEFYALLDAAHVLHFKVVGTAGGLLLILATWMGGHYRAVAVAHEWEGFVFFGVIAAILLRLFPQKHNPRPLETIAATFLGFLYVPFLFNFMTKLLTAWEISRGARLLVIYMIAVAKWTDIGAYLVGCRYGRHKLLPRISPLKTWEGVWGGLATGLLVSLLCFFLFRGRLGVVRFEWHDAVVLGLLLPAFGIVGDLTESLLKRSAGVKDSGRLIPGMGGILDVLDSLLFAAPALYIYARLFLEPLAGGR